MIVPTDDETVQLLDLLRQIRAIKTAQLDQVIATLAKKQRQTDR